MDSPYLIKRSNNIKELKECLSEGYIYIYI